MTQSDNRGKNSLRTIFDIENIVSEDSTVSTKVSNNHLTLMLPMIILIKNKLVYTIYTLDIKFSFEMTVVLNVKRVKQDRERKDNDDAAINILNYFHISGRQKIQTTPIDACKDDDAHLIVANISPLRPGSEASNDLSSAFGIFDIDEGNHLHLSETEPLLRSK